MRLPQRSGITANLSRNARFIRPALIALIAADIIALAAFSVRLESVTTTTFTPGALPVASAQPPVQPSAGVPVPPAAPVVVTAPGTSVALPTTKPETQVPVRPAEPAPPQEPVDPSAPGTGNESAKIARCVIPIKEPATSGGLQTLIGFAPAFGPFKDEAFAAATLYQPVLQLLGPILAKYPEIAPRIEPALTPFLDAFSGLLTQTFNLIAPLYTPYRQDILKAEAELAAALTPFVQKLATSPLGGCIVELQAVLLEDSAAPTTATKKAG